MTYCLTGLTGSLPTMSLPALLTLHHYEGAAVPAPRQTTAPLMLSKALPCLLTPAFLVDLLVVDVIVLSMAFFLPFHAVIVFEISVATVPRPRESSTTANPFAGHAIVDARSSRLRHVNSSPTPKRWRREMCTAGATLPTCPALLSPVAAPAAPLPPQSRARLPAPMEVSADALSGGSPQALPSPAQAPTAKMELPKLEPLICVYPTSNSLFLPPPEMPLFFPMERYIHLHPYLYTPVTPQNIKGELIRLRLC